MPHPLSGQEILFTRQRHEAKRAGLHWDYRLVLGDKAYSWATKKEMPEPGKATILFEQPIHDRDYALSKVVEIPDGEYGAGITKLDWVRKAKIEPETEEDKLVLTSGQDRFLLKKLDPVKYGDKAWLFKNLSQYLEGKSSTFTHDGKNYQVDEAIQLGAKSPIQKKKIEDLDWILKYDTPNQDRLNVADTKIPILVTNYKGRLATIDGLHRLTKAKADGLKEIPTRYVDVSKIKENKTKMDNKYLEKIAKNQEDERHNKWNVPIAVTSTAIGGFQIKKSVPELLGYHTVYHGTHKDNIPGIKQKGLSPDQGGINPRSRTGNLDSSIKEGFTEYNKGKIHVAKNPFIASSYAFLNKKDGRIVKARISHNQFEKRFKPDFHNVVTEFEAAYRGISDDQVKNLGAVSKHGIPANQIAGNKGSFSKYLTRKNLRRYLASSSGKNRFLTGVGRLALGTGVLGGGLALSKKYGGEIKNEQ